MKRVFLAITLIISVLSAKADEGMWLPYNLSGQSLYEMQQLGCKLTAEQIFNLNQPSLKDAIVQFGGGCTGELISPEGLLLTNHHCGLSYVQKHATVEHDYLTDGFWAYSKAEELPNPGLTVSFLANVEDVTDAVLKGVTDEETRSKVINENIEKLTKERKGDRDVTVEIVEFYHGASVNMAPTPTTGHGLVIKVISTSSECIPIKTESQQNIAKTTSRCNLNTTFQSTSKA